MFFRQLLLSGAAILLVVIFFNIGLYGAWYTGRLGGFFESFPEEAENLDYEWRKSYKWGGVYQIAKAMRAHMGANPEELILIPHGDYVKKLHSSFVMPEAITLYYFAGVKAVYPENKYADSARFIFYVDKTNVQVIESPSPQLRERVKQMYTQK